MELRADGKEVLAFRLRKTNPEQIELPVSADLIKDSVLTLEWYRPYGSGGGGRSPKFGCFPPVVRMNAEPNDVCEFVFLGCRIVGTE